MWTILIVIVLVILVITLLVWIVVHFVGSSDKRKDKASDTSVSSDTNLDASNSNNIQPPTYNAAILPYIQQLRQKDPLETNIMEKFKLYVWDVTGTFHISNCDRLHYQITDNISLSYDEANLCVLLSLSFENNDVILANLQELVKNKSIHCSRETSGTVKIVVLLSALYNDVAFMRNLLQKVGYVAPADETPKETDNPADETNSQSTLSNPTDFR